MNSSPHHADAEFDAILEDFITRSDRGDDPSIQEYLHRYPAHSVQLREFYEHWTFLNREFEISRNSCHSLLTAAQSPEADSSEQTIGAFRILGEIGSGSQGVVYRAEQRGTCRVVALKVMKDVFASEAERRRFEREVQLAARLRHSNIVSVFEYGREDGRDFFAMEYVDGEPLDAYVSARTISIRQTVELFLQVCDAVAYAHQQGVIHRDLKPSNILVDKDQQVRILDFGLAKLVHPEESTDLGITELGSFAGTWLYASPEQVARDGTPVDVRSDVYTLGVILFEMLTDNLPYGDAIGSKGELAQSILSDRRVAAETIRRDVPAELSIILLMTLKRYPEDRYQSASAFAQDLRRFLAGDVIEAKRDSRWYLLRKTLRYYRWTFVICAIVVAVLIAFSATVTVFYTTARRAHATAEARASAARAGQVHMIQKLDRLQQLENVVTGLEKTQPHLAVLQRLKRQPVAIPEDLRAEIRSAPPSLFVHHRTTVSLTPACRDWLKEHAPTMARLQYLLGTHRLAMRPSSPSGENWLLRSAPADLAVLETACSLLIASALSSEDHGVGLQHLDIARSLAVDLADGASIFHKGSSLVCREQIYRAFLALLQQGGAAELNLHLFENWLSTDPPFPDPLPAMVTERMKVLQLLEASTVASRPGEKGRLDLDSLDKHTGGLYSALGYMTEDYRAFVSKVYTEDAIAVLDRIAANQIDVFEQSDPIRQLLAPVLPSMAGARERAKQIEVLRLAAVLACELCQSSQPTGVWQRDLSRVNTPIDDPISGRSLVYERTSEGLWIYSLNLDGKFDEHRWGDWGDSDSDVLLFAGP